jgi:hypothetical protein
MARNTKNEDIMDSISYSKVRRLLLGLQGTCVKSEDYYKHSGRGSKSCELR